MSATRRRTLGLLLGAFVLAVGTPVYLAIALGLEAYLLHPALLAAQAAPYLLAGALWIPRRAPLTTSIGQVFAGVLLVAAGVLYVPMLTGLLPMGGDMVALAFIGIDAATVVAVFAATAAAYGVLYVRRRGGGE